jgi:hypothetical protein
VGTTDAHGRFVIENVPPGAGSVGIEPSSPDWEENDPRRDDCLEHGRVRVVLASGKREEVAVQIVRPLSISGRVLDAEGKPLAGVDVELKPQGHEDSGWDSVETGEDGTYRFVGLCPGPYRVTVRESLSRDVAAGSTGVEFRLLR